MVGPPQRSIPRHYRPRRLFSSATRTVPYSRLRPAPPARPSSSASSHGDRLSDDNSDSSPTYVQPSSPESSPESGPESSPESSPESGPESSTESGSESSREECPECYSSILAIIDLMKTVKRIVSRRHMYTRRERIAMLILLVDAYRTFTRRHAL